MLRKRYKEDELQFHAVISEHFFIVSPNASPRLGITGRALGTNGPIQSAVMMVKQCLAGFCNTHHNLPRWPKKKVKRLMPLTMRST